MHAQGIALWRWFIDHRRQLALIAACGLTIGLLLVVLPWLLLFAATEWKLSRRRGRILGLALAGQLTRTLRWLWCELSDTPHGPWHPCAQCGKPIDDRSRAAYCSHSCRHHGPAWNGTRRRTIHGSPIGPNAGCAQSGCRS
jgi:hypothetical protein